MFGLFSNKKIEVDAPVAGQIIDITKVKDEVFSSKMMGDGFAVEPEDDIVTAPCDGTVTVLAKTKHAVALETEGVELLIHIGLDTVELGGNGFTPYIGQGAKVKRGDRLIKFDRAYIAGQGKQLTTMLVITNMDEKVKKIEKDLTGHNAVLKLEVK